MSLQPLQGKASQSVMQADARINLWEGAVRSSKTISSLIAFLKFVRTAPPGGLLLAGRTERTVKANVVDPLVEWLGAKRCRYVKGSGELRLLGRKISVVGASSEQAEEKIRGRTLVGAYLDEVTLMPETFFKRVLSQLSLPGAKLFGTTNPDSPFHWLKTNYIDRQDELDIRVFHFDLADNPTLTTQYVEGLKAEYGGPGTLFYKRFIQGLWVLAEGAIFDMLTDRHFISALPPKSNVVTAWVGIDYGTANPFVAELFLHVTKPYPHILVASSLRWDPTQHQGRQKTDAQLSELLRDWLRRELPHYIDTSAMGPERIVVDPSAASFIRQLHVDGFRGVQLADNSVIDGIRSVASLLGAQKPGPRLLFHTSCVDSNREMQSYVWDEKAQEKGEDKPVKMNDHGPDARRYGIMGMRRVWKRWVTLLDDEDVAA